MASVKRDETQTANDTTSENYGAKIKHSKLREVRFRLIIPYFILCSTGKANKRINAPC